MKLFTISDPDYFGQRHFGDFYGFRTRNRDSDSLTRSNFICALKALGGESDDVQIHRFGHWACGWYEIIIVKHGTKAFEIAEQIEKDLEGYPVVNEEHFSDLEFDEACQAWKDADFRDRIYQCQSFGVSIFAARSDCMPDTPSGELMFNG